MFYPFHISVWHASTFRIRIFSQIDDCFKTVRTESIDLLRSSFAVEIRCIIVHGKIICSIPAYDMLIGRNDLSQTEITIDLAENSINTHFSICVARCKPALSTGVVHMQSGNESGYRKAAKSLVMITVF